MGAKLEQDGDGKAKQTVLDRLRNELEDVTLQLSALQKHWSRSSKQYAAVAYSYTCTRLPQAAGDTTQAGKPKWGAASKYNMPTAAEQRPLRAENRGKQCGQPENRYGPEYCC